MPTQTKADLQATITALEDQLADTKLFLQFAQEDRDFYVGAYNDIRTHFESKTLYRVKQFFVNLYYRVRYGY